MAEQQGVAETTFTQITKEPPLNQPQSVLPDTQGLIPSSPDQIAQANPSQQDTSIASRIPVTQDLLNAPETSLTPEAVEKLQVLRSQESEKIAHRTLYLRRREFAQSSQATLRDYGTLQLLSETGLDKPLALGGIKAVVLVEGKYQNVLLHTLRAVMKQPDGSLMCEVQHGIVAGNSTSNPEEPLRLPLRDILDGQLVANAGEILSGLPADSPERKIVEVYIANLQITHALNGRNREDLPEVIKNLPNVSDRTNLQKAQTLIQDTPTVEQIIFDGAKAVHMLTKANINSYQASLDRIDLSKSKPEDRAVVERNKDIAKAIQDTMKDRKQILVTTQEFEALLQTIDFPNQATIKNGIEGIRRSIEVEEAKFTDKESSITTKAEAKNELHKLHAQLEMLQTQAKLIEKGGRNGIAKEYMKDMEMGNLNPEFAEGVEIAIDGGDCTAIIEQIFEERMKGLEPGSEEWQKLLERKETLLKLRNGSVGFAQGFAMLIAFLAMTAMTSVSSGH